MLKNKNNNNTNKKAFTLIELLVVIAIIGILATIAVVALQQARQSARDSKRIADIKQIQTALELYYNYNSEYPTEITNNQIADATTVYMEIFPTAPTPADGTCDTDTNQYVYTVTGTENSSYTLSFCLGSQTGGLAHGNKCATPGGILDDECNGVGGGGGTTWTCGDNLEYQGYSYATVLIGEGDIDQCWFAENLRYLPEGETFSAQGTGSDSDPHYYVYDYNGGGDIGDLTGDDLDMYNNYGILYNWPAAMDICPEGWHLPSDTSETEGDWYDLVNFVGADPGTKLKSESWDGSDNYGFNALPAGYRHSNGSFGSLGSHADFWSSSDSGPNAWRRYLGSSNSSVLRASYDRAFGFSVRCLRTD
jgi:uncharacterized protein (TIGR02145 family)/prepilin-type N-terminal cleavage/methylation domain-containing protein